MKILKPVDHIDTSIHLTASKSESNRALIIQALCKNKFKIHNLASAKDTQTLLQLLNKYSNHSFLDAGPAGTTFRFLTAFLAIQTGEWTLTGSQRMKERPIEILVNAINELGGDIEYL